MRRTSVFAGAIAVLTPLLLVSAPSASATTSGSLTVTTLGRDGKAVSASPQAVNASTHEVYYLTSGRAKSLPKGTYDVIVDIWNSRDSTDTLGARRVTVSGAAKTTFDARQGRPVKQALSPAVPAGHQQQLNADLCVNNSGGQVLVWSQPGSMYVIPVSLATIELAYGANWNPDSGVGDYYEASGLFRKGLPNGISSVYAQSSLGGLRIGARSGPQTGEASIQLHSNAGDSCQWGVNNIFADAVLPYTITAHMSHGAWEVMETANDFAANTWHQYPPGRMYGTTLNASALGPGGDLPYTWGSGSRMYLNTTPMFSDSALPWGTSSTAAYRLSKGGKTLYAKTVTGDNTTLNPKVTGAGWYDLTVSATRHPNRTAPAATLSSASSLSLHFYANPAKSEQARVFLPRFVPQGLDGANRAKPGSTTTVNLVMQRNKPNEQMARQLPDSVKTVQAWTSTDGGKTWRAAVVKHSGSSWSTAVRNPASGTVSLRSTVTDVYGDKATATVVKAYAVG